MSQNIIVMNQNKVIGAIKSIGKTNTDFIIEYDTGETAILNILNSHVFKYYMSPSGEFPDYPKPNNPEDKAKINSKKVTDYGTKAFDKSYVKEHEQTYNINTTKIEIVFDKTKGLMSVIDKRTHREVLKESEPLSYEDSNSMQTLNQNNDEYYFGGGMQNGRFSHKGTVIHIVNSNNWVDGGVTSPCPFYWSSYGYGVLRNTWQPGIYDFGCNSPEVIKTIHNGEDFDAFFFINSEPRDILNDYYELTGQPLLMPEYAFYEAHLNAFNRDYWVKVSPNTPGAILFEDGKYYKSYKPNEMDGKTGILESLNGEKNNYQFSARAMIDRYKKHDMPLGWFIPNDGYGSGYGQTDSLDGDIENLKEFAEYARENGVQVALWTESQLEPKDPNNPKKGERDLKKEVGVAGVVALKCDVAWIGDGYSYGLNAVGNAADIFVTVTKHHIRPMIIMVDGWAGTQRHSGIWSGDQVGGQWEYIRFHIPTYIGTGLSGQPIVGSDMDGIYGGKSREVNIRDYQWKTFTPLQLNMDGWGHIPKTPFTFDDEASSINRAYLKLKSMLMPYNYTIGYESIHGLPMVRAMFLEFPKETSAYTNDSQYQYMWGPNILVAPIYNPKGVLDASLRDGIFLPDPNQVWIDFFTGEKYQGGKIYNNIKVPLWKIPVFIRDGAIIPMTSPNNNPNEIKRNVRNFTIYPNNKSSFELYEDDGMSSEYLEDQFAKTKITVTGPSSNKQGDLLINIHKSVGSYNKMEKERTTIFHIMASKDIVRIKAAINGDPINISKVSTAEEFNQKENVYYFTEDYMINAYLGEISGGKYSKQKFLLIKIQKTDITTNEIYVKLPDYANEGNIFGNNTNINKFLNAPSHLTVVKEAGITSITVVWEPVDEAVYYEIERDDVIFTNIIGTAFAFSGFEYESKHSFRIRSVNTEVVSEWSEHVDAIEKEDPYKYTVKGVKATCSIPCQPGQTICKLTDGDLSSMWHTNWNMAYQANPTTGSVIKINFDLGKVYEIQKMEYIPREDAGNGTILKCQYRYSIDGHNWEPLSREISWRGDNSVKTVVLNAKLRFMEMIVLESITGFGSGRQMIFYTNPSSKPISIVDPFESMIVKGVNVECSIPCQPSEEVSRLTDGDTYSSCIWHTKWDMPNQTDTRTGKVIILEFDLKNTYEIEKVEYYPRDNACNGNILKLRYKYSIDGDNWSAERIISWSQTNDIKTIMINGEKIRYMQWTILDSVGGFGSGKQVLFYRKNI